MKTKLALKAKQLASALLITLVICSILSLSLMYYLSLIEQQNFLNARSQTWNLAIAVSEAGVEDGLQQLNSANYPALATDGWSYIGNSCYSRSYTLPSGDAYVSYIFVTNVSNPTVVARSYVHTYNQVVRFGAIALDQSALQVVSRTVKCLTHKGNIFTAAIVARRGINLNGNNVMTDSYDSSDPTRSDPATAHGDEGDIATNEGIIGALSTGNANVYGEALTGVGSQQDALSIGANGSVGTHAWVAANGTGVEPGYWSPTANFTFPTTDMPTSGTWMTPGGGDVVVITYSTNTVWLTSTIEPSPPPPGMRITTTTVTSSTAPLPGTYIDGSLVVKRHGNRFTYTYSLITGYTWPSYETISNTSTQHYDHILTGPGNYVIDSASVGNVLVIGPNVVLKLPSGLDMSGGDTFTLAPAHTILGGSDVDANIQIYAGGTSTAISGSGVVNQPGLPANFIVYCTPTVTTVTLDGNGGFCGVLVAPTVDLTLNGAGSDAVDFDGAIMANTVTLNGHFNVHYDEALRRGPKNGRFLVTNWSEMRNF